MTAARARNGTVEDRIFRLRLTRAGEFELLFTAARMLLHNMLEVESLVKSYRGLTAVNSL